MQAMEQFLQSSFLLIFLSIVSVFLSQAPYLCLSFAGILLILFAVRSLSDGEKRGGLFCAAEAVAAAMFFLLSGTCPAYLILYEVRVFRWSVAQIFLPASVYGIVQMLRGQPLPQVLCGMIFLAAVSLLLSIVEKMIMGYIFARAQITYAVKTAAVNEMYERKLNQELILKSYLAEKNARLEERENISRNIHNSVGHSITAAIMTLDAADMLFDTMPEKAREKMNAANERIHASLESIRHAVRLLDHEGGMVGISDFFSALNTVTEHFAMDTTVKIRTDFPDADSSLSIPHEHSEFLTGAVQEILANGVRHGGADIFTISVAADSRHIRLSVLDNGRGSFSPQNAKEKIENGFGLKKLLSYAERCGGFASFENGNGFRSTITLPLPEEDQE